MRLYTCHIDNFGVLQDLDLDFRDRLHTVFEGNGWGKSTLAAFLLVMFYGFANEKSRSDMFNERRRYAPWQQGVYGGTVTFSWKGRLLRLERIFGLNNAGEDRTAVYDAQTNLPVEDIPDDPGETVFSIDRDSFAKTVFIAQQDCGTEATSGIQAKIGHLEGEEADMADFHQVQASLKKMADRLTPHRKTGEICQIRQELAGLESEVSRRPVYENTLQQLEEQLARRTGEVQRLQREMEHSQEELRQMAVIQRSAEDLSMEEEERERLQQLGTVFASGIPDGQQMAEAEDCLREIRKMRREFERAQREWYDPDGGREADQPRSGTSLISVLVFALFASALLAFFINRIAAAALAVLAVIVMIIVLQRDKEKEKEEGPRKPVVVVKKNTSPITKVTDLRSRREALKQKQKEIRAAEGELLEFLQQYYPDLTEEEDLSRKLQQLQYEQTEYRSLLKKQERSADAEKAWKERSRTAKAVFADRPEEDGLLSDSPEDILSVYRNRIQKLEEEAAGISRQIETVKEELDRTGEAEQQLLAMQEQLDEMQHRYDVLVRTRDYLAAARTSFAARFMEPVRKSFDRYFRMLTGEEIKTYQLDADLKIGIREYGMVRDPGFLSEGWQDLIGLCRRMAMIDAMYGEEKPFLLFDDPFVNLDGEKLQKALAFLQRISESYQVIYFTCHESRVP